MDNSCNHGCSKGCSNEKSHCNSKGYYVGEQNHYEKPKCKGEKEMDYYGRDYGREHGKDCCRMDHHDDCRKKDHHDDCRKKDHHDGCCSKDHHEKCDCCCTPGIVRELKKFIGDTVILLIGENLVYATIVCVDCDIAKIILLGTSFDPANPPATPAYSILSSVAVCEIHAVAKFPS